ncbi:hypothetical protein [Intestinibacter bartlettii]|uniref:hypothetical protein n=1 Tax=Intestinibacter bartlettii TaxID=261299 RepID=UPI002431C1E9|nr:hypothetical protein [Intestinibacter bartlettii]
MTIREILKESQPDHYRKLVKKHSNKKPEKLTEKEIKELMRHSSYKRGAGGAIRQVKQ